MRQLFKSLALATAMTFLVVGGASAANVPESTDPIKVIKNDWTGQLFSTEVLGGLLQKMGYNIEYVSAGACHSILELRKATLCPDSVDK